MYVSLIDIKRSHAIIEVIINIQLFHRQCRYSTINPPVKGPNTNPLSGANDQKLKASGLCLPEKVSQTEPEEFDAITDPTKALNCQIMKSSIKI